MRFPLTLLLAAALAVASAGRVGAQETATQATGAREGTIQRAAAQAAATGPAATQPPATQPLASQAAVAAGGEHTGAHPRRRPAAQHAKPRPADDAAHASAPTAESAGVLSLGATDITGNKELPKVMVIVPWKGSLGASGVIKPTDSLMDEVLQPVDRSVFQRRIRYYGQLNAAAGRSPAGQVAPVGDTH
ncbi:MAG: hypothetical protein ACRET2_00555 [Steroidobacteraceae bacterium]